MVKYAILLLIVFVVWHHYHHPAHPVQVAKTATKSLAAWQIDDANPDTRNIAQWMADCRPVQAKKNGYEIYSYWCTSAKNPRDKDQQLPKDWTRVY